MPQRLFEPCIPTRGTKVPTGPDWIHEIKHDGYRLIVQKDHKRVRLWHSLLGPGDFPPLQALWPLQALACIITKNIRQIHPGWMAREGSASTDYCLKCL